MAVVPILTIPDKRLNMQCDKVTVFDDNLRQEVQNLIDTLSHAKNPEGAGLAAPQIGVMKRMVVVRDFYTEPGNRDKILSQDILLVNPKIISHSKELITDWEACLSIPDTFGLVDRYKKVKVKAQDIDGNEIKLNANGYLALVVQHELDHLDGILFTSKVRGETVNEEELDKILAQRK